MLTLRNSLLALLLFVSLSACRRDDNPVSDSGAPPSNTFTVNGAGFNNRTFTIPDSVSFFFAKTSARFAIYDSAAQATIVAQIAELNPNFAGDAPSLSGTFLTFAFRGNRTGVYEGSSAGAQLVLGNRQFAAGDTTASGTGVVSNTSFRVNVTQYDNARVQGRYTGTFREINSPAGATVTVTGEFDVRIIAPNNLIIPILPGSAHSSLRDLNASFSAKP